MTVDAARAFKPDARRTGQRFAERGRGAVKENRRSALPPPATQNRSGHYECPKGHAVDTGDDHCAQCGGKPKFIPDKQR